MNEQEYKLIRNLAWDVLIDSKAARLPINLAAIASLYKLNSPEEKLSFYVKAFQISSAILQTFGLYGNEKIEYLSHYTNDLCLSHIVAKHHPKQLGFTPFIFHSPPSNLIFIWLGRKESNLRYKGQSLVP